MSDLKPQLLLSLRNYSKEAFVKDLVAGVIVAIIALPLSIALALASACPRSRDCTPPSWRDF